MKLAIRYKVIIIIKKTNNLILYGTIFKKFSYSQIPIKREYVIFINTKSCL